MDGKQRISSVMAFYKGHIPCHDDRGEKWYFCDDHGRGKKKVLSKEAQEVFLNKVFITYEYDDLEPDQEEDLFARVQLGIPLSTAERLRAQTGPWQNFAKIFCQDFPLVYNLQKDTMRAKDFQLTLQCFSQVIEVMTEELNPICKTTHAHLVKLLQQPDLADDDTKSHFAHVWTKFSELVQAEPNTFTNANKWLKGVQTFAPVEMIAVVVLISVYLEKERSNDQLLDDIRMLRQNLRENFKELRIGQLLWKEIWKYIYNLRQVERVTDRSTVRQSAPARAPKLKPPQTRPAPGTKRLSLSDTFGVSKAELNEAETAQPASHPRKRQRTESAGTSPTLQNTNIAPLDPQVIPFRPTPEFELECSRSSSVVRLNPISKVAAKTTLNCPSSTAKASTSANGYRAPTAPMGFTLNTSGASLMPINPSTQSQRPPKPLDQPLQSITSPSATRPNRLTRGTFKKPTVVPPGGTVLSALPRVSKPWQVNAEPLSPASRTTTSAPVTPKTSPHLITTAGPNHQRQAMSQWDSVIDLTEDGNDDDDSDEYINDGARSEEQRSKNISEREARGKERSKQSHTRMPPN